MDFSCDFHVFSIERGLSELEKALFRLLSSPSKLISAKGALSHFNCTKP